MLSETLEIVLTLKILGPLEIGGLGLILFSLMVSPRLIATLSYSKLFEII